MAGNFGITADDVRLRVGITSSNLSDANTNSFIVEAEAETEQFLKTKFSPTRVIERYVTPNSPNYVMLRNTPLSTIISIQVGGTGGTAIDPSDTQIERITGRLILQTNASKSTFDSNSQEGNYIEYEYARMEESTTSTSVTALSGTGDAVAVNVSNDLGFDIGDNVLFSGIDGNEEIVALTGTGGGANTLSGNMKWTHGTGSRAVKMQTPVMVKNLAIVLAAIKTARYMIGSTFTFATSYSIPELSVNKGVPYPHFEKVLNSLIKEREDLMKRLRPTFHVY